MTRRIQILSALLVLQIVLAASLAVLGRAGGAYRSGEKLLPLDLASLDEIRIEEKDQPALVMRKEKDGTWVLPDHFGFPVSRGKLERVIGGLLEIPKPWPVGATAVAARRFKVADSEFERKISFSAAGGPSTTLLTGTSPGFKKAHVRLVGEDAIYAIDFQSYQASVEPADWEDKELLHLEPDEIVRVEMPDVTLVRQGENLVVSDLAEGEETDPDQAGTLLSKLSRPSFLEVLGKESKPEYRQGSPVLSYTLEMKSGERLDYRYSRPEEGSTDVLRVSSRPEYFETARYSVESLQKLTRAQLVREQLPEAPSGTAAGRSPAPPPGEAEEAAP